jgi:hypothetical protein
LRTDFQTVLSAQSFAENLKADRALSLAFV